MRLVQFSNPGEAVVYPAEGIDSFGATVRVGDLIIGEYFGAHDATVLAGYSGPWPVPRVTYKTSLLPGEVLVLLGATAYVALHAAAYPRDASPVDPQALFFLESAKHPYSDDGLLLVDRPPVTDAMAYFVAVGYITQADADRVKQGKPI